MFLCLLDSGFLPLVLVMSREVGDSGMYGNLFERSVRLFQPPVFGAFGLKEIVDAS